MGKRLTNEEFIAKVKEKNPNIIPLEEYIDCDTKIKFMCEKGHVWETLPRTITSGHGCPECGKIKAKETIVKNTKNRIVKFADVRPELAKHLVNKKLGFEYGQWSKKEAEWECPICNTKFYNKIVNVSRYGLSCPACAKGRSYPNKFMHEILKQLKIDFEAEYSPDWIGNRKYDFYFVLKNKKYIIEMDGAFHFKENTMSEESLEHIKNIDDFKTDMANKNGITVIRIDCNYGDGDKYCYIKTNIIKTLSFIFDFSDVDFDDCNFMANKNILEIFSNSWEKHKDVNKVCADLKYNKKTAIKYLKMTEKYGLSSYCNEFEKQKNLRSIAVKCIETGEIFMSIAQANKKYHCTVDEYLKKENRTYSGKLPDGTKLHWKRLTKEEAERLLNL